MTKELITSRPGPPSVVQRVLGILGESPYAVFPKTFAPVIEARANPLRYWEEWDEQIIRFMTAVSQPAVAAEFSGWAVNSGGLLIIDEISNLSAQTISLQFAVPSGFGTLVTSYAIDSRFGDSVVPAISGGPSFNRGSNAALLGVLIARMPANTTRKFGIVIAPFGPASQIQLIAQGNTVNTAVTMDIRGRFMALNP